MLEAAKRQLLAVLPHLPPDALLELLEDSFPYLGLRDLKDIPLAVLDRINPVPASFLRQIAADADLFQELPIGVQLQMGHSASILAGLYSASMCTVLAPSLLEQFCAWGKAGGVAGTCIILGV